ncbi:MAG: polysaccharide deacetylase family protein [Rhodothermales bacterium]|nr:polysaccharide deacetylase family protein [Rhodothermales bacterium]
MFVPREERLLDCCVEAPPAFLPKARYALRMLLLPLGLAPRWVERGALAGPGLYYGPEEEALPAGCVSLSLRPETAAYFAGRSPYPADRVRWMEWGGTRWPVLFDDAEEGDLVASAFFWLAGWQEHTVPERDRHGRFPYAASLQAAFGTPLRPAVDAYRERLAERLQAAGVDLHRRTWGGANWALCPTHDVDYLRKWRRGLVYREAVPHLLLGTRGDAPAARLRRFGAFLRQWARRGDVYREALVRLHRETRQRGGTATFFFKTGAHGPFDVPYPLDDPFLHARVAALRADGFEVGLHPSYHAHTHAFYLADEAARLAELAGARPVSVRQHYLRYTPPTTPRLHARHGFRIDTSLGFAEHEGFRHATCHPFQLYDVQADAPLDVWEMPLAVMESALFNRRGFDPDGAVAQTKAVMETVRRFRGVAVLLWHNILWDELDHPDWGRHFEATLDHAVAGGARIASLRAALAEWLAAPAEVKAGAAVR